MEDGIDVAGLDDLAGIHDVDPVAELGDDAEMVRDDDDDAVEVAAQLAQQMDDLRLHRHVERGGRLVGDQQAGIGEQRGGDGHPLAHAARQLVRIGGHAAVGIGDADALQHGGDQRLASRARPRSLR